MTAAPHCQATGGIISAAIAVTSALTVETAAVRWNNLTTWHNHMKILTNVSACSCDVGFLFARQQASHRPILSTLLPTQALHVNNPRQTKDDAQKYIVISIPTYYRQPSNV